MVKHVKPICPAPKNQNPDLDPNFRPHCLWERERRAEAWGEDHVGVLEGGDKMLGIPMLSRR
jgi:hypothetical protein